MTEVTVSSGDTKYQHLKAAGDAYAEIVALKAQVAMEQKKRTAAEVKVGDLRKENKALRRSLSEAEHGGGLNENDVRMLLVADVVISFRRKFAGGCRIKARRNGRTLTEVSGSESTSLLPRFLKGMRRELRDL